MKIAIFGGSIAGLATAGRLEQQGHDVSLWERASTSSGGGFGILLPTSALSAFDDLALGDSVRKSGIPLDTCTLIDGEGGPSYHQGLSDTFGIDRATLISILRSSLQKTSVCENASFVDFEFDASGAARRAVLADGRKIAADLFIGADGILSSVRDKAFPSAPLSRVKVVERVGSITLNRIPPCLNRSFCKIRLPQKGIAVGLLPVSETRVVWFLQADLEKNPEVFLEGKEMRRWFGKLIRHFPSPFATLCTDIDPCSSVVCRSTDRELPSQFHQRNILLVGDAAHPLLPFTSQGAGSAVEDARDLCDLLKRFPHNLEHDLQQLARRRLPVLRERLRVGRRLQRQFLVPRGNRQAWPIPIAG